MAGGLSHKKIVFQPKQSIAYSLDKYYIAFTIMKNIGSDILKLIRDLSKYYYKKSL
jgi:hypothetical protein